MTTDRQPLPFATPGASHFLGVQRFGLRDARPRIYIQAALHADEIPGMLAAHHLRQQLGAREAAGTVRGEVILVPSANPLGLHQRLLGKTVGRFALADGVNFNRAYPHLSPQVGDRIASSLTADGSHNVQVIREALRHELAKARASSAAEALKHALLELALPCDTVLDLHCDSEAVVHLYTHPRSAGHFGPLAALLGAQAMLLAEESGEDPFDEACSRLWAELAGRFPQHPIPFGCHSATIELRGERDVNHLAARTDAQAIIDYLTLIGALAGPTPAVPAARCTPTPLAGSEPVVAPAAGIVVFRADVGERVATNDVIAEIIDPHTGAMTPACATTDGVMFARVLVRFATQGQPLAKIAGAVARRSGKLLTQ